MPKKWKGLRVSHVDRHHTYLHVPFELREGDIEDLFDIDSDDIYALFENTETREVPVSRDLVVWQSHVTKEGVQRYLDDPQSEGEFPGPPHVVKYEGRHYILDGTHRFTAALLRGDRTLTAAVVDLDSPNPSTRKLKNRLMR